MKHTFGADKDMVAAWNRLANGTATELDQIFLKHEITEVKLLLKNPRMDQETSHKLTNSEFPWADLLQLEKNQNLQQ